MHDVENDDKMSNVIVEKYQSNIDNKVQMIEKFCYWNDFDRIIRIIQNSSKFGQHLWTINKYKSLFYKFIKCNISRASLHDWLLPYALLKQPIVAATVVPS